MLENVNNPDALLSAYFLMHKYDNLNTQIEIDNDLLNIGKLLVEKIPNPNKKIDDPSLSFDFKDLKDITKDFFKYNNIRLHKIRFISYDTVKSLLYSNIDETLNEIYSKSKLIDPTDLEVSLIDGISLTGSLEKPTPLILDKNYLIKVPILFSKINLGNNITKITPATYIHEITHTQLESNKGSVRNILNKEVLSIF